MAKRTDITNFSHKRAVRFSSALNFAKIQFKIQQFILEETVSLSNTLGHSLKDCLAGCPVQDLAALWSI